MSVVLIGFSGTGKSSVGKVLAGQLGWEFVDTDSEVERAAGKPIHRIFAEEGEAAFRCLESQAVLNALRQPLRVVAVGGGAVLDPTNRKAMKESSLVVLLEAGVSTIHGRLLAEAEEEPRPLLKVGGDPRERIAVLKTARDPIYRETADLVVSTEGLSIEAVARQVAERATARLEDRQVDGQEGS